MPDARARMKVEVPPGMDAYIEAVYKPTNLRLNWEAKLSGRVDDGVVIVVEVSADAAERLRDAYLECGCRVGPIEQVPA